MTPSELRKTRVNNELLVSYFLGSFLFGSLILSRFNLDPFELLESLTSKTTMRVTLFAMLAYFLASWLKGTLRRMIHEELHPEECDSSSFWASVKLSGLLRRYLSTLGRLGAQKVPIAHNSNLLD